jgi:putative addiction module CopG family antidote
MTISLPPEWEEYVAEKLRSGEYATADEVVSEGLLLLRHHEIEQEDLEELRREIALGIADDDTGKVAPFDAMQTLARVLAKRNGGAEAK